MNHRQATAALENVLPEMRRSGDVEGVLLKYARSNNLAPAQLEMLGRKFNTARFLTHVKKAGDEARSDTIPLLDVELLSAKYMGLGTKTATSAHSLISTWCDAPEGENAAKSAAAFRLPEGEAVTETSTTAEHLDDSQRVLIAKEAAAQIDQVMFDTGEDLATLRIKAAAIDIAPDAFLFGEDVKTATTLFSGKCGVPAKATLKEAQALLGRVIALEGIRAEAQQLQETVKAASPRAMRGFYGKEKNKNTTAGPDIAEMHRKKTPGGSSPRKPQGRKRPGGTYRGSSTNHPTPAAAPGSLQDFLNKNIKLEAQRLRVARELADLRKQEAADAKNDKADERNAERAHFKQKQQDSRDAVDAKEQQAAAIEAERESRRQERADEREEAKQEASWRKGVEGSVGASEEAARQRVLDALRGEAATREPLIPKIHVYRSDAMDRLGRSALRGAKSTALAALQDRASKSDAALTAARRHTRGNLVLRELSLTDPVISGHDPEKVAELFDGLAELNPAVVRNKALVRPLLREALEYGAVPLHQQAELAKMKKYMHEGV